MEICRERSVNIFESMTHLLKASLVQKVGRKVQGAAGLKGKDPEEYRGQKGASH